MPISRYAEILERYPESVERIKLFQHGEPTVYPWIVEACEIASLSPQVARFGFATNGNFKTSLLRELFEVGLPWITFSFDGVSREVYEDTCRGGDFDLVEANIVEACRLRDEKYPNVVVAITVVRSSHTERELLRFNDRWSPHLKRDVFVLDLHDWTGDNVDPTQLDYLGYKMSRTRPTSCISPWKYTRIYYNGDVVPCCTWLWEPLGNVFQDDLYEIWNNEKYRSLRGALNVDRGRHEYCSRCYLEPELTQRNPFYPLDRELLSTVTNGLRVRLKR